MSHQKPAMWVVCPVCQGERFLIYNRSHVACPVCEMDGGYYSKYPNNPMGPGMIRVIKKLLIERIEAERYEQN